MNYILYAKRLGEKRFGAMNLQEGTYHVGLLYATLIPDLDRAIGYADNLSTNCPEYHFCVRPAGKTRTVYAPEVM